MHYAYGAEFPDAPQRPWRAVWAILGIMIVFALWFGTRVYVFNHFQDAAHPATHPMTRAYQEMAVSLDEGRALGEINVSRFARNRDADAGKPYPAEQKEGDVYENYRVFDPGYGLIFHAARKILYFMPDTVMRPVMLQLFLDGTLLAALFFTFLRWGWLPAVGAGILYSSSIVFALASATPWYHFWDGLFCTFAMLQLLWLYRLGQGEDEHPGFKIFLACLIGITLGCALWLRSSWFAFAPVLLIAGLCWRPMRPWLLISILVYGLFAGGMIWRATGLNDALSFSTRTSWHTAFQGLGRNPNIYGFEDNDSYLIDRAYQEDNVDYNLTDYRAQDAAMKNKYMALWEADPAYIMQSVAQRMFSNIFFNFNSDHHPFWNHGFLLLALLGVICGLWLGGEFAFFAILSGGMYLMLNFAYAFVYYITREYSVPTQMLLLFCNAIGFAGIIEFARRMWRRDWLDFRNGKVSTALIALMGIACMMVILLLPPVQKYLTPNQPVTQSWDSPLTVNLVFYYGLRAQIDQLPEQEQKRLLNFMAAETIKKSDGPDEPVYQFAEQHLRHVIFTNQDGKSWIFWLSKNTDRDSYEALTRSARSIAGLGFDWIQGFEVVNPESWDGKLLQFKLLPNPLLDPAQEDALLQQKFKNWNWKLTQTGDREYMAEHSGAGCPESRRQLNVYFDFGCKEQGDVAETP